MNVITEFDLAVLDWIQQHLACKALDFVMPKITMLGNMGAVWILAAIIMLFFKRSRKTGVMIGAGLSTSVLIGNVLLKNLIARERPCLINTTVDMLIAIPRDYSFPSGHTFTAFVSATILFYYNKRLGIAAFVLAAAIGFSRLYLYVHFPTDVLAGAILGIALGCIICKAEEMLADCSDRL